MSTILDKTTYEILKWMTGGEGYVPTVFQTIENERSTRRENIIQTLKSSNTNYWGWVTIEQTNIPVIGVWLRLLFSKKELFELSLKYGFLILILDKTPASSVDAAVAAYKNTIDNGVEYECGR